MLRTHRSLEGLLCNPMRKMMKKRFFCFSILTEHRWNETDRGKPTTRRKTCPSATLSTTNPTWTDPGLRGERPATNRLSHGTATSAVVNIIASNVGSPGLEFRPAYRIFNIQRLLYVPITVTSRSTAFCAEYIDVFLFVIRTNTIVLATKFLFSTR
jgi:hypothetical protein